MNRILAGVLALAYAGNGLLMLAAPAAWYAAVPGLEHTGPLNTHFVRDIGFVYLLSGVACAIALGPAGERRRWIAIGTAWPALHAGFHLVEWGVHGLPAAPVLTAELLAVVLPVAIGLTLVLAPTAARDVPGIAGDAR